RYRNVYRVLHRRLHPDYSRHVDAVVHPLGGRPRCHACWGGPLSTCFQAFKRQRGMRESEILAAKLVGIGFIGPSLTHEARALIRRGVRNVILFARNVESPQQLAGLTFEVKAAADS